MAKGTKKSKKFSFLNRISGRAWFMISFAIIGTLTIIGLNAQTQRLSGRIRANQASVTHQLQTQSQGTLTAVVSKEARKDTIEAVKFTLTLKDSNGKVLQKSESTNNDAPVVLSYEVGPGTYDLVVGSVNPLSNKGVWYVVDVQLPDVTKDTLAPVVTITNSDQLLNTSGTVNVTGTSSDAGGLKATRLIINGNVKQTIDGAESWNFSLDTTAYSDGNYELVVESEDNTGNKGKSGISMVIDNTPAETDPNDPIIEDPTDPTPTDPEPEPVSSFLSGDIFETSWSPSSLTGWSYEESGIQENIVSYADYASCYAGGYAASTHYARIRRKLPERDNFASNKRFVIESTFDLPSDFYDKQESYMRVITTDNYPGIMQSTGQKIGANDSDEWRVGFTIYGGDSIFRLISAHQNNSELILWKNSSQLPVGQHTVRIHFDPSPTSDGAWELFIDGVKVGGADNVKTVPSTLSQDELYVTRVAGCIDGASNQDTKIVQVNLRSLIFRAER